MVGMDCYWFDLLHLKMAFWTSDWTASASLSCISTLLHVGGLDMTEVLVTGIDGRVFIPIGSYRGHWIDEAVWLDGCILEQNRRSMQLKVAFHSVTVPLDASVRVRRRRQPGAYLPPTSHLPYEFLRIALRILH